jgi:predicted peroxiredoxin
MDVLYVAASGSADPTRASIPWHLAVNGSLAVGQEVGILLLGDASEVLRSNVRAGLVGVGIPPIDELINKARDNSLPIFV